MRKPGAILLLSCYELGHQPFHLASLAGMLAQAGYAPALVDTALEPLTDAVIEQARFVGIAAPMHTALRLAEQLARRLRGINPTAHICLYGLYALLNADYLLRETIDSAIAGEYEGPLLRLIAALELGEAESARLPGVRTRQAASGPWLERASFVVPERRHLPALNRYTYPAANDELRVTGSTETTRGCKHTCSHCPLTPVYGGRFFVIPRDIVLADIRQQVQQGAQHITFADPDFFNGPTHALRIVRALHSEFPDVTFDATIKVEHLLRQRHLLPEMKTLGCAFIVTAVESLNDDVLRRLHKGHTSQDVATVFSLLDQVGIPLRPSLLPFSPWETLASYIDLLTFVEERRLIEHIDPVHFSIRLLIPPGSALLASPDSELWLGELDPAAYTYHWRHPDPRMDILAQRVTTLAEQAEEAKADPVETFFHIKALALAVRGQHCDISGDIERYGPRKVLPHLTESWFC